MGRHACEALSPAALAVALVNRIIDGSEDSDAAIKVFGRTTLLQPRQAFDGRNSSKFDMRANCGIYVGLPRGPKFSKRHAGYDAAYVGFLDMTSGVMRVPTTTTGLVSIEVESSRSQDLFDRLPFEAQFSVVRNTVLSLIDSTSAVVTLLNSEGDLKISARYSSSGPFRFSDSSFIGENGVTKEALKKLAFNELCYLSSLMDNDND